MRKYLGILLLLFLGLPTLDLASVEAYPLTLKQREQLKAHIPRTFSKLESQRPVHIVALGDSVTWMYTRDDNNGNWLLSYLGHFGNRLAREFFYPGGVRALNPEEGKPAKLKDHLGKEIYIENLAVPGRCAMDALQRITTDAFVNNPDLVVIDFGINDAVRSHSLDSFRRSLQRSVDVCRANRTDVIILAPNLIRISSGPTGWGDTRTYATVAREVAKQNDVLFVDLGAGLAPLGGGVPSGVEPEAAVMTMADRLGRIFEFDPMPETPEELHPNEMAHEMMGRVMFDAVVEPLRGPDAYSLNGRGFYEDNSKVKVRISLRNQSDTERKGYVGALSMGHALTPADPYRAFSLAPGKNVEMEIDYLRTEEPAVPGGRTPMDIGDPNLRLSYFVIDETGARLMDVVTRLEPVGVEWSSQSFESITDGIRFEWHFINGAAESARGKYRIGMGESASDWVPFDLDPLGNKKFQATFPFRPPPGTARLKIPVFIEIDIAGKSFTFPRELEAVADISLGQRVALSRSDDYTDPSKAPLIGKDTLASGQPGVVMRADADQNSLFFTFDFEGVPFAQTPDNQSLTADISLDARPASEVKQFGFVDKLRVLTGATDGPAKVERPPLAAFGEGYNMVLMPQGIEASLKTRSADAKRLEIKIPRSYLFLHEWRVGAADSVLGLNVNLSLGVIDSKTGFVTYPAEKRYVLTAPNGITGEGLYFRDARGLATLRLTTEPVKTWSAHLY